MLAVPLLLGAGAWTAVRVTEGRLDRHYEATLVVPPVRAEDAARGMYLMTLAKCGVCHGADFGGGTLMDEPLLGSIHGPNLTTGAGGIGGARTDADLTRAIRHGLAPDGRPLIAMPTREHAAFSNGELGAVIAALRALPPVDRSSPPSRVGLGLAVFCALDQIELIGAELVDHAAAPPAEVPPGPTVVWGGHLARIGSCHDCHGEHLSGGAMAGAPPDWPDASNLTPHVTGLAGWTEEEFYRALREGVRPDGTAIDPRMPWAYTAKMTDDDLRAIYLYLLTVPARPSGQG
ncbi:MAG: c-type cytochrome [Pseudomonadota bacterium]|nr:c-type cytochrome [Pseudomonadota bacterium]